LLQAMQVMVQVIKPAITCMISIHCRTLFLTLKVMRVM